MISQTNSWLKVENMIKWPHTAPFDPPWQGVHASHKLNPFFLILFGLYSITQYRKRKLCKVFLKSQKVHDNTWTPFWGVLYPLTPFLGVNIDFSRVCLFTKFHLLIKTNKMMGPTYSELKVKNFILWTPLAPFNPPDEGVRALHKLNSIFLLIFELWCIT